MTSRLVLGSVSHQCHLVLGGIGTWTLVSATLADQNITTAEDSWLSDREVCGPLTAYAQADVIEEHALEATGGQTFAELDREDPLRDTAMNASFLQASLFTSVLVFGVAAMAIGMGLLFVLIGLGIRDVKHQVAGVPHPFSVDERRGTKWHAPELIRILLVDDHEVVRQGLRTLLEDHDDLTVVAEAATVAEAVQRARTFEPDVAVLDVRLPDGSGVEACRPGGCRKDRQELRVDRPAQAGARTTRRSGRLLRRTPRSEGQFMSVEHASMDILDSETCRQLLHTHAVHVGRVGSTDGDGRPVVLPLKFRLDGDDVVLRTGESELVAAVRAGRPVAFEVDHHEPLSVSGPGGG